MKTVKFKDLPEKVQTFLYENQHSLGYFFPESDIQLNWLHNISIWGKATDEERLAYAEWKYRLGQKVFMIHRNTEFIISKEAWIKTPKSGWAKGVFYTCKDVVLAIVADKNYGEYLYNDNKWAEIIEEPEKEDVEMNASIKRDVEQVLAEDSEPTFKAGDEVDCFVENGSEKEWIPAIFYAKAFHEKRPWKECYVVAYKNTGNVDIVTEIRKIDPDKIYREIAKEIIGNARVHEFTSIEYITVESAESMLIEALKKGKGL